VVDDKAQNSRLCDCDFYSQIYIEKLAIFAQRASNATRESINKMASQHGKIRRNTGYVHRVWDVIGFATLAWRDKALKPDETSKLGLIGHARRLFLRLTGSVERN